MPTSSVRTSHLWSFLLAALSFSVKVNSGTEFFLCSSLEFSVDLFSVDITKLRRFSKTVKVGETRLRDGPAIHGFESLDETVKASRSAPSFDADVDVEEERRGQGSRHPPAPAKTLSVVL